MAGGLVLAFHVNVNGTATGVRGANSSVTIPLNQWSHVAASFDSDGPDRDTGDPSVGRIRIYVNGADVTTSDVSGPLMQPGSGESHISVGWGLAPPKRYRKLSHAFIT